MVEDGFRSVTVQLRGYPPSTTPLLPWKYSVTDALDDLDAIVARLGVTRTHLVGHDWGGIVAWGAAIRRKEYLVNLTVLSTPHPRAAKATSRQVLSLWYYAFLILPGLSFALVHVSKGVLATWWLKRIGLEEGVAGEYVARLRESPGALRGALGWYRSLPLDGWLTGAAEDCALPTLYIWGESDPTVPREAAEATGRFVRGRYEFVALESIGRWIPEMASDYVAEALSRHIRSSI